MSKLFIRLVRWLILAGLIVAWGPQTASASPASSYTVNSTLDTIDTSPGDGVCADFRGYACTLRAAVMEANAHPGPDTILLPGENFLLTRAGANEDSANTGDLDLTDDVTIGRADTFYAEVDAAGLGDRVFDVHHGATVSISVIVIRGGAPPAGSSGGGVQNNGTLTLTGVLISSNAVTGIFGAAWGGGIANLNLGVLALNGSQVFTNTAGIGGGISNGGEMIMNNSAVYSNAAGNGAGIWNGGKMIMSSGLVRSNAGGFGGGITNQGELIMSSSEVISNTAYLDGGGIYGFQGTVVVTSSTFSGNHADSSGGGVYARLEGPATITITHSTLVSNTAGEDGRGIFGGFSPLTLANDTIAFNTASRNGGGIASAGTVNGYSLTIADNKANLAFLNSNPGRAGGGFYNSGGYATLSNSILASNGTAANAGFGTYYVPDDCTGPSGEFHYSLVQENHCIFTNDNTVIGYGADLNPLGANGGSTLTYALQPQSLAVDAANPAYCESPFGGPLPTDQRGWWRHLDGNNDGIVRCDMGAYEYGRLGQVIEFPQIADQFVPSPPFVITASATSGLTVAFISNTPAVCAVSSSSLNSGVSSATVALLTKGVCTLTAQQAGDTTHNAAAPVIRSFDVFARLFLPLICR